jgi:hypothetical protein
MVMPESNLPISVFLCVSVALWLIDSSFVQMNPTNNNYKNRKEKYG